MNMSVPNVGTSSTQGILKDPNKPAELNSDTSQSITTPPPTNSSQPDRYTFIKECRDWATSLMWAATLMTGLFMTYGAIFRSNFKEITDALNRNDVNLHEVLKALGENNKNTAEIIRENNEHVRGAIDKNTESLKEVLKVLDKDGDGKLSEAEIKEAQMLMEEAKKWKNFTDAINEATKKK